MTKLRIGIASPWNIQELVGLYENDGRAAAMIGYVLMNNDAVLVMNGTAADVDVVVTSTVKLAADSQAFKTPHLGHFRGESGKIGAFDVDARTPIVVLHANSSDTVIASVVAAARAAHSAWAAKAAPSSDEDGAAAVEVVLKGAVSRVNTEDMAVELACDNLYGDVTKATPLPSNSKAAAGKLQLGIKSLIARQVSCCAPVTVTVKFGE